MRMWDRILIVFLVGAGIFVILSMEKCDLQQTCLRNYSSAPGRSAKECGL